MAHTALDWIMVRRADVTGTAKYSLVVGVIGDGPRCCDVATDTSRWVVFHRAGVTVPAG